MIIVQIGAERQSNALNLDFFIKRLDKIEYGLLVMMRQK
jgi:hypothetical protein